MIQHFLKAVNKVVEQGLCIVCMYICKQMSSVAHHRLNVGPTSTTLAQHSAYDERMISDIEYRGEQQSRPRRIHGAGGFVPGPGHRLPHRLHRWQFSCQPGVGRRGEITGGLRPRGRRSSGGRGAGSPLTPPVVMGALFSPCAVTAFIRINTPRAPQQQTPFMYQSRHKWLHQPYKYTYAYHMASK